MRALIDDLLAYSRVGSEELAPTRVDLADVVARVLQVLDGPIRESGAVVDVGSLPEVVADPIKIEQVMRNLVANAIKFRRPDEPPQVSITSDRGEGAWRVTVADNGIGIDLQYSSRVFEMFQRLHTRDEYPGTGVGLAICRRIVDRHGGSIWLEPASPQGTRIHFTVPDHETLSRGGVNVLVVEDNPGDVLLMRQGLATWTEPTEVRVVSDGEEALSFLQRAGDGDDPLPDLVILDVNLPRVHGTEVLARMRSDPRLERIPVVVMSSSTYEADSVAAYDAQTTCFVAKPMDVPDYRAAVRSIERFWRIATHRR
ncbi:MAG: ATP-binding protein [Actinomycetota bacterium]